MKTFLSAIAIAFSTLCFSQNGTIKGTITAEGQPLEAVTVQLEGKTSKKMDNLRPQWSVFSFLTRWRI